MKMRNKTIFTLSLLIATNSYAASFNFDSPAFWDNPSWDGPGLNVGNLYPGLPHLNESGNPTKVILTNVVSYEFLNEISNYQSTNAFGYFELVNPIYKYIFFGSSIIGNFELSPVQGELGFFIVGPGGFYDSINSPEHFALFKESEYSYILGMEDLHPSHTDVDYNDMILRIKTAQPVPEPGTLIGLGTGLILFARRMRKNQNA